MASYPLLSQAPTHVEVELGCDKNSLGTSKSKGLFTLFLVVFWKLEPNSGNNARLPTMLFMLNIAIFQISVRSGGHGYSCNNIRDGGIHIDMRG